MSIGKNIKIARVQKGLLQKELAEKVGCTQTVISNIERDKKNVSDALKIKFSIVLEKDIKELFYPDDLIESVLETFKCENLNAQLPL